MPVDDIKLKVPVSKISQTFRGTTGDRQEARKTSLAFIIMVHVHKASKHNKVI